MTRNQIRVGCSRKFDNQPVGCNPVEKPCNPVPLLQLSTLGNDVECYCDQDGCNKPSEVIKTVVGGYLLILIAVIGMIGNILAIIVLMRMKTKHDINIILTGNILKG